MSKHKQTRRAVVRYNQVFSYEHLLASHFKSRRGKRLRETNIKYDAYQDRNLNKLEKSLKDGTYTIKNLYSFTIREPKERKIVANQYEDKIVQRCICDYMLEPIIAPVLILDNYASQPGKGTDFARARFEKFLRKYIKKYHTNQGYVLQIDIKSYFGSIDREILYSMVEKLPIDDRCKKILHMQIYSYRPEDTAGICIGFQTMQWLAVYYMNGLDHHIKETLRASYYGRYMDDLVIIHNDLDELQDWFKSIQNYLENKLNLKLNTKSKIRRLSDNTTWLGFKYRIDDSCNIIKKVNKDTLKRFLRRLRKYNRMYMDEELAFENIAASINSWKSHVLKCDNSAKLLKYLDKKALEIFGEEFYARYKASYKDPKIKRK